MKQTMIGIGKILLLIIFILLMWSWSSECLGIEVRQQLKMIISEEKEALDWAETIAIAESDVRQVNSASGKDFGVFQIHAATIKLYGLDKEMLQSDLRYQLYCYLLIMEIKRQECKSIYPESWPACWHSATPEYHTIYWNKLRRIKNELE